MPGVLRRAGIEAADERLSLSLSLPVAGVSDMYPPFSAPLPQKCRTYKRTGTAQKGERVAALPFKHPNKRNLYMVEPDAARCIFTSTFSVRPS